MSEALIAFLIWLVVGLLFVGMGTYALFSQKAKPMGFWANAKMFEVTDVRKYNAAVGKLFIAYGIVFILLGLPLLSGQNSGYIILTMFGVMAETLVMMAIYSVVIEKKYKKK